MNPLILAPVLELGKSLIDRFIPDKTEAAKAEAEFLKQAMSGDLTVVIKQLEVNAIEAASPRLFIAGWRPYFGWVGGTGFAYVVLLKPFATWLARIKGWPEPPDIDTDTLWVVVTGLLGIGTLRSFDKRKGVHGK